ncbi:MAG: UDP-2,4-diacetamido-2,4,6-trideoxy-beta-L-altropyranose hydrolase [Flavobacteriales bacterium]|nr:UDP-2,4-diacetamido-2,4,6-trideoxy-beta-L-altropyranose hydrolase [Flavobacteriales bacterium]
MKIVIRVDASLQISTGHVIRCLTLANTLREKGAYCEFICREHKGNLIHYIEQHGFTVHRLSTRAEFIIDHSALRHAAWLGSTQLQDAQECLTILQENKPDWLIVDHYGIDKKWEQLLRPYCKKIFVIDDLADRQQDCDLLLDQNLIENMQSRYIDLVPQQCIKLIGPKYALLQSEYSKLHKQTPRKRNQVQRIFAYFGGVDTYNLTTKTITAFNQLKQPDIELDLVVSALCLNLGTIENLALHNKRIHLHQSLASLAPLMIQADLAIGAGGATSWERCCLGLPSIVVTVAENQEPIAKEMHKQRYINWIGNASEVDSEQLLTAMNRVIDNANLDNWSKHCATLVDGLGAQRVVEAMMV